MPDAHANFAFSTVATAPSPATSGTSLVVAAADGAKFPAVPFNAVVTKAGASRLEVATLSEIVRVTARSTDTLTITRAQEGTAARSIIVGDEIWAGLTTKTLTDIESAIYASMGDPLVPTGVTYQSYSRFMGSIVVTGGPTVSGTMKLMGIWLPRSFSVNSISFVSGTTALTTSGTAPHFWVALYDSSRALLRQSNDDTAATWASSSLKTVNLSSAFVTTYEGLYYCGLLVNQGSTGTPPTLTGSNMLAAGLAGLAPILTGNSTTGLTATAPDPAGAITVTSVAPWCGVS